MGDLVEFLRARLSEDEQTAYATTPDPVATIAGKFEADARHLRAELAAGKSDRGAYDEGQADALHWAATVLPERMPPLSVYGQARVLREIEAKRRTLVRCEEALLSANPMLVHFAKYTLWEMAQPYAGHPSFREEWRP